MQHFREYCAEQRQKYSSSKAKRELYSTDVKRHRLGAWNIAVRDADRAYKISRSERLSANTIPENISELDRKETKIYRGKKRKREETGDNPKFKSLTKRMKLSASDQSKEERCRFWYL